MLSLIFSFLCSGWAESDARPSADTVHTESVRVEYAWSTYWTRKQRRYLANALRLPLAEMKVVVGQRDLTNDIDDSDLRVHYVDNVILKEWSSWRPQVWSRVEVEFKRGNEECRLVYQRRLFYNALLAWAEPIRKDQTCVQSHP